MVRLLSRSIGFKVASGNSSSTAWTFGSSSTAARTVPRPSFPAAEATAPALVREADCQLWPVAALAAAARSRGESAPSGRSGFRISSPGAKRTRPTWSRSWTPSRCLPWRSTASTRAGKSPEGWIWWLGAGRRQRCGRGRRRWPALPRRRARQQRRRIGQVGGVDQAQQRHRRRFLRVGRDRTSIRPLSSICHRRWRLPQLSRAAVPRRLRALRRTGAASALRLPWRG